MSTQGTSPAPQDSTQDAGIACGPKNNIDVYILFYQYTSMNVAVILATVIMSVTALQAFSEELCYSSCYYCT